MYTRLNDGSATSELLQADRRETQRIERFLGRVFPVKMMRKAAHSWDKPILRRVTYKVITQGGVRFVLVGYSARWKVPVNVIAIYRLEDGWPNQVWRSNAWLANYYGMRFETAKAGNKTLVLFEEGGIDQSQFALAGLFTFRNYKQGLAVYDVTPSMPNLRADTRFPFRSLLARGIALEPEDSKAGSALLTASDEEYVVNGSLVRPTVEWRFDARRNRFESTASSRNSSTLTNNLH